MIEDDYIIIDNHNDEINKKDKLIIIFKKIKKIYNIIYYIHLFYFIKYKLSLFPYKFITILFYYIYK